MIKIGMMIGDRYEILEKIGTGGMSDVYKAKCHKLNRFVAVKVLKQEFSENANFVSKFRVEAQAAAGLMHPNIVNVYDVGEENGIYYIVMELVEGKSLWGSVKTALVNLGLFFVIDFIGSFLQQEMTSYFSILLYCIPFSLGVMGLYFVVNSLAEPKAFGYLWKTAIKMLKKK